MFQIKNNHNCDKQVFPEVDRKVVDEQKSGTRFFVGLP